MYTPDESNKIIIEQIKQNTPFFVGRIAGVELYLAYHIANNIQGIDFKYYINQLQNNAGIYTESIESLKDYSEQLIKSYIDCTQIAEWDGGVYDATGISQEYIKSITPNIPKIHYRALEPYYFKESWDTELSGKRVLIIHPFMETFKKQIRNLQNIFPDRNWFNECQFDFLKPPVTLAGNHNNIDWKIYYNQLKESVKKAGDFDIALVACGGYGMLICDYIFTELNKSVIYVGGALQLFFGVIGRRWFENKEIMALVNDEWIRPLKSDKPLQHEKVEKGCYW